MDHTLDIATDRSTAQTASASGSLFGAEIDAFLAANDRQNPKNFVDFVRDYMARHQLTMPALSKAWAIDESAIHSWLYKKPPPTPSRITLDHLTARFHLSPAQEINLWSIAKGDLSLPTVEKIAFSGAKTQASPVKPEAKQTAKERTQLWDRLMARTGLSLDKLASLSSLSDRNIQAIHAGKQTFQSPKSALDIARAFSPNDAKIAVQIGRIFLGIPREFPAEELAQSLIDGHIDSSTFLTLNRLQKFDRKEEAATAIGVSPPAYNPWERVPKTIRWRHTATHIAEYAGIGPKHSLYTPLIDCLSGRQPVRYSTELLQSGTSAKDILVTLRACHDLSIEDMAYHVGITPKAYAHMESKGRIGNDHAIAVMNALYIPQKDWPLFVAAFAPDFQLPSIPDTTIASAKGTYQAPLQTPPRPMKDIMHDMMREKGLSLPDQISSQISAIGVRIESTRMKLLLEGKAAPSMTEQTAFISAMGFSDDLRDEYIARAKMMNEKGMRP